MTASAAAAEMDVAMVQAASRAADALSMMKEPRVTDRNVANYDVYITFLTSGQNEGKYYIGFAHSHLAGQKNKTIGCFDSFGGHAGGILVDATSGATTMECK